MEYENWYNDPFVGGMLKDFEKQEDYGKYNARGEHICTLVRDGRKQKICRYYYRNGLTKKCLFLGNGLLCEAREED